MLIPSNSLLKKIDSSPAGLWFERIAGSQEIVFAIKLPSDIIKAINCGARISIIISVIEIRQSRLRCIGLQVEDDPRSPFTTFRCHRENGEHSLFRESLSQKALGFHFFDELGRPVLESICSLAQYEVARVLESLTGTSPHYVGPRGDLTESALNIFESDLDAQFHGEPMKSLVWHTINVDMISSQPITVLAVGTGKFRIDDPDEGSGLEQSAHELLEYIYPTNLYRSPHIELGHSRRELTDILAFSFEGLCLVESKVFAVKNTNMSRPTDKRVGGIEKQISKGLRQLVGAIRKIRSGAEITTKSGRKIELPKDKLKLIQGIVLISTMHPSLSWKKIAKDIFLTSKESKALFHVLDLIELYMLVAACKRSDLFNSNLCSRWEAVLETGDAFIRSRIPPNM